MRRLTTIVILAAGALASAVGASAQTPPAGPAKGLGIRLAEAPADRTDDPRALQYIVDHVAPGTTLKRKVEVENGLDNAASVRLYGGAAAIRDGVFTGIDDRAGSGVAPRPGDDTTISGWLSVSPTEVMLEPAQKRTVEVTIAVPADASGGERYGAIWAELPPVTNNAGIEQVSRVGVRVYLSVGAGEEPKSDFVIDTLTAERRPDGTPVVTARVENTGKRALDMTGDLALGDGPGGLSAGPFAAKLGTTLQPGATESVEVTLDERIPNGPWLATMTLRSGTLQREATATITFPEPGAVADPVRATPASDPDSPVFAIALALLGLVLLGLLAFALWARRRRRRRDGNDDESPPPAAQVAAA